MCGLNIFIAINYRVLYSLAYSCEKQNIYKIIIMYFYLLMKLDKLKEAKYLFI